MKIDDGNIELSSGRKLSANRSIIGLCIDKESEHYLNTFDGYDGELALKWDFEKGCEQSALTSEERAEIADYMIEQWRQFKE